MNPPSLLAVLDAPVVVGDPDGRAAYVNPAFEACFAVSGEAVKGQPLAVLFEGGVREAVLSAVAEVCEHGTSTRFRVRHAGVGYAGMASPIVAQDARVGFVILLFQNPAEHERTHEALRRFALPLEEVGRVFDELGEQVTGRVPDRLKLEGLLEEGQRAVEKLRRAGEELSSLLAGRRGGAETPGFDPAQVAREVAERMEGEFSSAGIQFETRIPSGLPPLAGDARLLESLLLQLLRNRVGSCGASSQVSLAVGALERGGVPSVVIRVSHRPGAEGAVSPQRWAEPDAVVRLVQELGGEMRLGKDAAGTQATAIRLTAQPQ